MIKGVHHLTLHPNMLISIIDQFTIFNGWMNGQPGGPRRGSRIFCQGWQGGGPGPTARIQDPHMGPIHTYLHACMSACMHTHTHIHIYACTDRHMNVHAQADGKTFTYIYKRQIKRHTGYLNMHNHVQRQCQKHTCVCMSRHTCACHYLKISH